jgi:hypothetical protein
MATNNADKTGQLVVSKKSVFVPAGIKDQHQDTHKFIAGDGEIVVQLSNFTRQSKFFNVHIEEVDANGKSFSTPAKTEVKNKVEKPAAKPADEKMEEIIK